MLRATSVAVGCTYMHYVHAVQLKSVRAPKNAVSEYICKRPYNINNYCCVKALS